jgi:hypothetical protein
MNHTHTSRLAFFAAGLALLALPALCLHGQGEEPKDDTTTPPVPPPAAKGVRVLFSGKPEDLAANWLKRGSDQPAAWKIKEGAMVAGGGDIVTKEEFGDFQLHLEFKVPYMPNEHGQGRGNSGVGLHSRYEIQLLDSYGIADPGTGDCGAVYGQAAPLVNACKPPRQWQTYDITFRAPRFDDSGKMVEKPRVTVYQNGICVQNNHEIAGMTGIQDGQYKEMGKTGNIDLQDHGNPMQFRNIWILPLPPQGASHY